IQAKADAWVEGKIGEAIRKPYPERNEMINQLKWDFHRDMAAAYVAEQNLEAPEDASEEGAAAFAATAYRPLRDKYDEAFTVALHKDVRQGIVEHNVRPDGRAFDEIRPISSEVSVLPRVHGSSIFTRGV